MQCSMAQESASSSTTPHNNHFTTRMFAKSNAEVALIGVPFSGGQPRGGVDLGPKSLRDAGVIKAIEEQDWKVTDLGDVNVEKLENDPPFGNTKQPLFVGKVNQLLHEKAYASANENKFVLTVGGDHSVGVGSISGVLRARPDTCIIWVDAHADINTHKTSQSGNMHGMPVAFLLGLDDMRTTPGFEWLTSTPILSPDRIAYIGLRDVDYAERELLKKYNIAAYSMRHVDDLGIAKVLEKVLDKINPNRDRPIHISFDVDGIDPSIVPATGTAVPGGLTMRESRYICEVVEETGLLGSFDLMEVNPLLSDSVGQSNTLTASLQLVRGALGYKLV